MSHRTEELLLKRIMQMLTPKEAAELENFANQSESNRELVDSLKPGQQLWEAVQSRKHLDVEAALKEAKKRLKFNS